MYINNTRQITREAENGSSGSGANVAWQPDQGDLVIECILSIFVLKVACPALKPANVWQNALCTAVWKFWGISVQGSRLVGVGLQLQIFRPTIWANSCKGSEWVMHSFLLTTSVWAPFYVAINPRHLQWSHWMASSTELHLDWTSRAQVWMRTSMTVTIIWAVSDKERTWFLYIFLRWGKKKKKHQISGGSLMIKSIFKCITGLKVTDRTDKKELAASLMHGRKSILHLS